MPKLNQKLAKQVGEQEVRERRGPAPAGRYLIRLKSVEATKSRAGDPMWKWRFEVDASHGEYAGLPLFENTTLIEAAYWKLAAIFAAFGAPPDTATDDLIGRTVYADLVVITATQGKLAGREVNEIDGYAMAEAPSPATPRATEPEPPF